MISITLGTFGYIYIENYTFTEALFMTVITMSTVGYREIHPLSETGMIFTVFLIIMSFGIFAYGITTITRFLFDGEFRTFYKNYQVEKKIKRLNKHVIICGYGRNGIQAVAELLDHNESVIIIETLDDVVNDIVQTRNLVCIHGDATREDVLEKAGIIRAKALITTLPSDADNLFIVLTAREMNPEMTIISRASDDHSDIKLKRAGATNVIMPDKVGGARMAKLVAQPDIVEFLDSILIRSGNKVNLVEIACADMKSCFLDKTIGELNIRSVSGANLVGLKTEEGSYIFNPSPDIKLMARDKLFALGTPSQIDKLKEVLSNENTKYIAKT